MFITVLVSMNTVQLNIVHKDSTGLGSLVQQQKIIYFDFLGYFVHCMFVVYKTTELVQALTISIVTIKSNFVGKFTTNFKT